MALTPEGTPYVESTDLVANYPAASLSLADRVDLVGVLPFADAAARTAAIPTPTDGQFTYLQDTNTPEFYDGSNFVPVGTAPGLVHINTTTFTAETSFSIDNIFTATYENYWVMITADLATGDQQLRTRLRVAGADASGNNYTRQLLSVDGAGVSANKATETFFRLGSTNDDSISVTQVSIWRPALAVKTAFLAYNEGAAGSANMNLITGSHSLATAYDGLTIFPASSNITGTVRVYGYKNS